MTTSSDTCERPSLYSYMRGCGCSGCREANRLSFKRWEKAKVLGVPLSYPSVGARRRIWALLWLGYPLGEISRRTGVHRDSLRRIRDENPPTIYRRTHLALKKLLDEVWDTPCPPTVTRSDKTRRDARKAGYPPPLAWEDIDDPNESYTAAKLNTRRVKKPAA